MAQSITDKIIALIAQRLTDSPDKPAGMTVVRSKRRPVEPSELPLTYVRPIDEEVHKTQPNNIRCRSAERNLMFEVTVRCVGTDADLDPVRTWAIETVMSDLSVGGMAIEIEEAKHNWDAEDAAEADYAQDVILFTVRYQTSRATPVSL